jgi:hypothetical protein
VISSYVPDREISYDDKEQEENPLSHVDFDRLITIERPKPMYRKPIELKLETFEPVPTQSSKVYDPECERTMEEEEVLKDRFLIALKDTYEEWARGRKQKYAKEPKYTYWFYYLKWKKSNVTEELDAQNNNTLVWEDELDRIYFPEIHEVYDTPDFMYFQDVNDWQSSNLQEVIKLFHEEKNKPKNDFIKRLKKEFVQYNYKDKIERITTSVDLFLDPTKTDISHKEWHAFYKSLDPTKLKDEDLDTMEKFMQEFFDSFGNGVRSYEEKINLAHVYMIMMNHLTKKLIDMKDKKGTKEYFATATLQRLARDKWSEINAIALEDGFPWHYRVKGRFQLQLIQTAWNTRDVNTGKRKHFRYFSDYIFKTCM